MFGKGLIKGLIITWKRMFAKKATVKYPFEQIEMFPRFHGRFKLDVDKCIACGLCVNACPNKVIELERVKVENKQTLTRYCMRIEYCLFCGLCVEACPTDAIKFSSVIDMNQYRREWVRLKLADRPVLEFKKTQEETPIETTDQEVSTGKAPGEEG